MVVFTYRIQMSVDECHKVLENMDIPGNPVNIDLDDKSKIVWKGDKWVGIQYNDTQTLELYGTKNTNSVQFYKKRYPKLVYDDVKVVRTKRW